MRVGAGALAVLVSLLLGSVSMAQGELQGAFEAIGPLPRPHSLKVVLFEEYLNFTCPHCNNFRKASVGLKQKFGKRLKIVNIPILFRGQTDAPLRLFFVGQAAGKEEATKNLIFEAAFKYGVNIYDPGVVSYLARSSGLGAQFQAEAGKEWVTLKVQAAQAKAGEAGIRATPTVILQKTVRVVPEGGMKIFVGTLDTLIDQLLLKLP